MNFVHFVYQNQLDLEEFIRKNPLQKQTQGIS